MPDKRQGLLDASLHDVIPAEVVECRCFPSLIACDLNLLEAPFRMMQGVGAATLPVKQRGKAIVGDGLAPGITKLLVQGQGLAQVNMRFLVCAKVCVGVAQMAVGAGLSYRVTEAAGRCKSGAHHGHRVLPVPAAGQELPQYQRHQHGMAVEPVGSPGGRGS